MVAALLPFGSPLLYEIAPPTAAERLYVISRDVYAPVLAAFARRCLNGLRGQRGRVNLCLARDGISAFLAQQTLLRAEPRRLHGIAASQVRLAYVSRALVDEARWLPRTRTLLAEYLREQGLDGATSATLVDVGIHGSIQDELQALFPRQELRGEYLLYRRRPHDANAERKRGFLAGDASMLGDEGESFLRRPAIHLLEDTWSGLHESVTALRVVPTGGHAEGRVRATLEPLGTRTPMPLPWGEMARLKRAALRGVVEGVALSASRAPRTGSDLRLMVERLGEWVASAAGPNSPDAWLWRTIVRQDRERHSSATWGEE